jgi:hypothetical protein
MIGWTKPTRKTTDSNFGISSLHGDCSQSILLGDRSKFSYNFSATPKVVVVGYNFTPNPTNDFADS